MLVNHEELACPMVDVTKSRRAPVTLCFLADACSVHSAKWVNYFSLNGYKVHLISFEEPSGISSQVKFHKLRHRFASRVRYFSAAGEVRDLIREICPDLLHAHYASGYGTLGRLAKFHPYVLSVWGSDVFDFPSTSPVHSFLIRKNLNCADYICSTSHVMALETAKYYQGTIAVTPFGVDCSTFRPRLRSGPSKEFVVGTVKSLEEKYGIDYLIKTFAILKKKYDDQLHLRLVIAGTGSMKFKLQKLASSCGVGNCTDFIGFVAPKDVPNLLNTFSLFAALSVYDSESFGVAVVEASASGLPVVVSDAAGLTEVVRNGVTGVVVPRRNPEAAASAISQLIENGEKRLAMGIEGRKLALSQFNWDENAARMERIYASILGIDQ